MTTFLGMRGTGNFADDERPMSWREQILKLYPTSRKAPLTAILSKMSKESVDDPQFHWWTETFQNQGGAITGIYKSADLSTGTGVSAITAGQTLYINIAEAVVQFFRVGHQAILRNTSDYSEDCNGKITAVVRNGASSYVVFRALQASAGDPDDDFNRILIVGNINPEGGVMPDALSPDPVKWYNYTQIWRTPLSITRTAQQTKLRTGNAYQRKKAKALEDHSIEMEKSMLFGFPSENVAENGQKERTTMGIIPAIRGVATTTFGGYPGGAAYTDHNGVVSDFPTANSTKTWLAGGEDWLDEQCEQIFKYGDTEKLAFCGNKVLRGISRLVKHVGQFSFTHNTVAYGIKVMTWVTNYGTIHFLPHPLFNMESSLNGTAVVFEPRNCKFRYIQDTKFYAEGEMQNTGAGRVDGKSEEYLTEAGLEYHHPIGWAFLTGFNDDGAAS